MVKKNFQLVCSVFLVLGDLSFHVSFSILYRTMWTVVLVALSKDRLLLLRVYFHFGFQHTVSNEVNPFGESIGALFPHELQHSSINTSIFNLGHVLEQQPVIILLYRSLMELLPHEQVRVNQVLGMPSACHNKGRTSQCAWKMREEVSS